MSETKRPAPGFTLIETAIVILIFGVIIASGLGFLKIYESKARNQQIKDQMAAITAALEAHIDRFGMLPCPASLSALPGTKEFAQAMDCRVSALDGLCAADQSYCVLPGLPVKEPYGLENKAKVPPPPSPVRIGAVPARQINIPLEMTRDVWGNRILYAVSEDLAKTPRLFQERQGSIGVVDESGRSVITPSGSGAFVLISHGPDGMGAVSHDGGREVSPCVNDHAYDQINCSYRLEKKPAIFRAAFLSAGALTYDDYISYETKYSRVAENKSCESMPLCSAENIDSQPVCQLPRVSGLPLCTHRQDVMSGAKSDPYEHDFSTWAGACNLGAGWGLPSLTELRLMHQNQSEIGGFTSDAYYLTRSAYNPTQLENNDRQLQIWAIKFDATASLAAEAEQINISPKEGDSGRSGRIRCVMH